MTGALGDSSAAAAGRLGQKQTKVTKGRRKKIEAGSIIALRQCESLLEFFVPFVAFCFKDKSTPSMRNGTGTSTALRQPQVFIGPGRSSG